MVKTMHKNGAMMILVFLLASSHPAYAGKLDGAWSLTHYEFQNNDVPVSGLMIFAEGYFAMVYKMGYEGRSARGHGGRYHLSGDEINYTIPWWVQDVAGEPRVFKDEVVAKGQVEQFGDQLVIRFASGSVQKFKKLSSTVGGDLAGAWLMDHYESRSKSGPTSGLIMYAGNNFVLIYTMDGDESKDGRAHAGSFQRDGEALTLSVNWSLQVVGGVGSVDETSSSRETKVTLAGDSLAMELGGGSVQKFHHVGSK